ncbi:hypothetical protein SALBM311S_12311 [Streptomyces alboniger]
MTGTTPRARPSPHDGASPCRRGGPADLSGLPLQADPLRPWGTVRLQSGRDRARRLRPAAVLEVLAIRAVRLAKSRTENGLGQSRWTWDRVPAGESSWEVPSRRRRGRGTAVCRPGHPARLARRSCRHAAAGGPSPGSPDPERTAGHGRRGCPPEFRSRDGRVEWGRAPRPHRGAECQTADSGGRSWSPGAVRDDGAAGAGRARGAVAGVPAAHAERRVPWARAAARGGAGGQGHPGGRRRATPLRAAPSPPGVDLHRPPDSLRTSTPGRVPAFQSASGCSPAFGSPPASNSPASKAPRPVRAASAA